MMTIMNLFYCRAADVDWDPEINFDKCLELDISTTHSNLSQACGIDKDREEQEDEISNVVFYQEPDLGALYLRLKNEIWVAAKQNVSHNATELWQKTVEISELLNEKKDTLIEQEKAYDGQVLIFTDKMKRTASDILTKIKTAQKNLLEMGVNQRRMFDLNTIASSILKQMNAVNKCSMKLAQVGESLFLSGEQGRGEEVLKECNEIKKDELKGQVDEINKINYLRGQNRRFLSTTDEYKFRWFYSSKKEEKNVPLCLREANYSECMDVNQCDKKTRSRIERECRAFRDLMNAHMDLSRAKIMHKEILLVQTLYNTIHRQSVFLSLTSNACVEDAKKLYNVSYANVQTLVNVATCGALAVEKWNHIVEVCLEANKFFKIYFPFYNVVTLVNRWNCLRMWNAIIAVSISLGSSFLLVSLLLCVCKVCWRQQKPYVLPVHVGKSHDRHLMDEAISRRLGSRTRMTSETMALEDVRKKESLSQVAR